MLQARRLISCSLNKVVQQGSVHQGGVQSSRFIDTQSDVISLDNKATCQISPSVEADPADPNRLTQLSGFKAVEQTRKVQIFVPAKNVMQSGTFNKNKWRLRWDTQQRYENPLMGWSSSADPLSNMHLEFGSPQAAVNYCIRHGFEYEVIEPKKISKKVKSYGANFAWSSHSRIVTK